MQPCRCSFRALELFINDLSDLSLRQSARRPHTLHLSPKRRFSKFPRRLNAIETSTSTPSAVKDDFVPFEKNGDSTTLTKDVKSKGSEKVRRKVHNSDEEGVDDEWHAEIEILAPWPGVTSSSVAEKAVIGSNVGERQSVSEAPGVEVATSLNVTGLVEDGSETGLQTTEPHDAAQEDKSQTLVAPEESKSHASPAPQRSKVENRQARRLRRELAGTYRQEAEAKAKAQEEMEEEEEDRTEAALRSIEAIEGEYLADGRGIVEQLYEDTEAQPTPPQTRTNDMRKGTREPSVTPSNKSDISKSTLPQPKRQPKEQWQIQKAALESKFGPSTTWSPRKRLSPDALTNLRALHSTDPNTYSTETLATHFAVSPEAIRRILKSKWRPNEEEVEDRRQRWERRGESKWKEMAKLGVKPPRKWRDRGIRTEEGERERMERRREVVRRGGVPFEIEGRSSSLAGRIL